MHNVQLPNSRFLYQSQKVEAIDVSGAISVIDEYIHHSNQLSLAKDKIIIEFSKNPKDTDFPSSTVLVGRSVVGYDEEVFSQILYKDYKRYNVIQTSIKLYSDWHKVYEEAVLYIGDKKIWMLILEDNFSSAQIQIKN